MWIGDNVLDDAVASARFRVGNPIIEGAGFRVLDAVLQITPFFMAKGFTVGDEQLKIAGIGTIHIGIVNLVDDAVAQREPDAASSVVCAADALFGAAGPARFHSRRAKS